MNGQEARDDEREEMIAAAWTSIADADRCVSLHITPSTGTLHRRLREVTRALADAHAELAARKHPEPETTKAAQAVIDAHMRGVAHRVMDVFENADDDALAEDVMQDVFAAVGILAAFRVPVGEGEQA